MTPRQIRQLRDRLRMDQTEFACVLGLRTKHQVSALENGHRRPSGPLRVLLGLYAAHPALAVPAKVA